MTPRELKRRHPEMAALIPDIDLYALTGPKGNLDAGMVAHLQHYAATESQTLVLHHRS